MTRFRASEEDRKNMLRLAQFNTGEFVREFIRSVASLEGTLIRSRLGDQWQARIGRSSDHVDKKVLGHLLSNIGHRLIIMDELEEKDGEMDRLAEAEESIARSSRPFPAATPFTYDDLS